MLAEVTWRVSLIRGFPRLGSPNPSGWTMPTLVQEAACVRKEEQRWRLRTYHVHAPLLEGALLQLHRDGVAGLEHVGHAVRDSCLCGQVQRQRQLQSGVEHGDEILRKDVVGGVKDVCVKEGPGVVHIDKVHTVGVGLDVELLEEGQLGRVGPVALLDEVDVSGHLDLPVGNLGLDL